MFQKTAVFHRFIYFQAMILIWHSTWWLCVCVSLSFSLPKYLLSQCTIKMSVVFMMCTYPCAYAVCGFDQESTVLYFLLKTHNKVKLADHKFENIPCSLFIQEGWDEHADMLTKNQKQSVCLVSLCLAYCVSFVGCGQPLKKSTRPLPFVSLFL